MKTIKKILAFAIVACMALTLIGSITTARVSATTLGTPDAFVSTALQYKNCTNLSNTKATMKNLGQNIWYESINKPWCAWFVSNCAAQAGLGSSIGASAGSDGLPISAVNKGGTITFVNKDFYKKHKKQYKKSRRCLNTKYQPRKGDIIVYGTVPSSGNYRGQFVHTHVGIVGKSSSNPYKKVYTIEGNKSGRVKAEYVSSRKGNIKKKKIRYNELIIVAYVTPKFKATVFNHEFTFDMNGGTGSVASFKVQDGKSFTVPQAAPFRSGYVFRGWAVKRLRDQTWFSDESTGRWMNTPPSYKIYTSKKSFSLDTSWRKGAVKSSISNCGENSNYRFTAQWTNKIKPANPGSDFTAVITSKNTKRNLTVSESNVQTASSNNNTNSYQQWRFIRQSNGSYKIINIGTNKVMDACGARSVNGTNVQVAGNNDSTAQRWYVCKYNDGYVLVPIYCDIMLDVDTDSNTNVQLWGSAATYSTIWSNHIFYINTNLTTVNAKSMEALEIQAEDVDDDVSYVEPDTADPELAMDEECIDVESNTEEDAVENDALEEEQF